MISHLCNECPPSLQCEYNSSDVAITMLVNLRTGCIWKITGSWSQILSQMLKILNPIEMIAHSLISLTHIQNTQTVICKIRRLKPYFKTMCRIGHVTSWSRDRPGAAVLCHMTTARTYNTKHSFYWLFMAFIPLKCWRNSWTTRYEEPSNVETHEVVLSTLVLWVIANNFGLTQN